MREREREEPPVPAAAADGAQLALAVETLEDDAGVVGETAHDGGIKVEPVGEAIRARDLEEGRDLVDGLTAVLTNKAREIFDRLDGERAHLVIRRRGGS